VSAGIQTMGLMQRRDGLLREAEHLEKRLKAIHEEVTQIQLRIPPMFPVER